VRKRNGAIVAAAAILLLIGSAYYAASLHPGGTSQTTSQSSTLSNSISSSSLLTSSSVVTDATSPESSGSLSTTTGQSGNWTTYHADNARTGYETVSNFTSVSASWTSVALDGDVYAEPLVLGNAVYVATENNSVYALDAQTGAVLWRTNLGTPVPGDALQCGNIDPSGITGTPVIDAPAQTIFVVTFSNLHHFLYGLNIETGVVVSNRSADPPGFVDTAQQERSALSLANGMVYIPYGGLAGDCGPYHGWVVGLAANGTGSMDVYQVPTGREGGIWAPSGAAIDSSGTLYVSDGNGASDTTFDHGDAVISLSPSLSEEGFFAPSNWVQLNQDDTDLGSVGPSIVGPGTLFQIGKAGVGYLLDANQLGGIGGQQFSANVCNGSYGGTAYVQTTLYVPCSNGLFALSIGTGSFNTAWHTNNFDAGPPIVTGGVVWSIDLSSSTLYGFSAATGHQSYSFSLGSVVHFCTPSAGDGRIFVAADDHVLAFLLGAG
jgi:outer membrane protein assembly factor BamB